MAADALTLETIASVAVIGSGTMGSGIAQVFAQSGFPVVLQDTNPEALARARTAISRSLSRLVEKGVLAPDTREQVSARLTFSGELDVVSRADLVIEAITEQADAKRRLFGELDRVAPVHACLASNTSSISITSLAQATTRADRVVGLHFMNPVPLMPLVEVVRGRETSDQTMALAQSVSEALGKTPVPSADVPGFIANRVLMPMINEAAFALMEGVGTAEAIDTVMRLGMNHPMGPLALADLIGLDVCVAILDVMRDGLKSDKYAACPLFRTLAAQGRLGRKTGSGFYDYPA